TTKCREGKNIFGGTDTEMCLCLRVMGLPIVTHPDYRIQHYVPKDRLNLRYLAKLAVSYGKTDPLLLAYKDYLRAGGPGECPPLASLQGKLVASIKWRITTFLKGARQGHLLNELSIILYTCAYYFSVTRNYEVTRQTYA